jgi:isoleucyl-tRNA synthetase
VLEGVSRLLAPFVPFLAERLYRGLHPGLVGDQDSVHLASWPAERPQLRDPALEEAMAAVLQVVGLGRSLRQAHELRVRQPLAEGLVYGRSPALRTAVEEERYRALIADELNLKRVAWLEDPSQVARVTAKANFRNLGARFGKSTPRVAKVIGGLGADSLRRLQEDEGLELEVDGETVRVGPDDLFIQEEGLAGYVTMSERDAMLALRIELDGGLVREGLARELINRIQNLRKQAGLAVSDRIALYVAGDAEVEAALTAHRERICEDTLAETVASSPEGLREKAHYEIDGHPVVIALDTVRG